MTQAEKDEVYAIIYNLGTELYDGVCKICRKPMEKNGKGFTIHHRDYKDGEKDWNDFKHDPKQRVLTDSERLAYLKYLEPIIRKEPWRFRLYDNWHHVQVGRLRRFKDDMVIIRLFLEVLTTDYPTRRHAETRIPKV